MTRLVDHLEDAIKTHYVTEMAGLQGAPTAADDLRSVLTDYLNWRRRLIETRPRAVHLSPRLVSSQKAYEHAADLKALTRRIATGGDLTPHLGKRVTSISRRDRMLAAWGIHHLHLQQTGTQDLLFGLFQPDDAYLVGIYPHESWALQEVAEVAVRSWPGQEFFLAAQYATGLSAEFSDADRAELLANGINTGLMIDGKVFMGRALGQTLDGGSLAVQCRIMGFIDGLNQLRWNFEERMAGINADAERTVGRPLNGEWTAAVDDGWFGVFQDEVFVRLGELI